MQNALIFTKTLTESDEKYSFVLTRQGSPGYQLLTYRQNKSGDTPEANIQELTVCGNHLKEIIDVLLEYHAYIKTDPKISESSIETQDSPHTLQTRQTSESSKRTPYSEMVEKQRQKHQRAYAPWPPEDDEELTFLFQQHVTYKGTCKNFWS